MATRGQACASLALASIRESTDSPPQIKCCNLPRELTSFVGREMQGVEVSAALRRAGLVTLIGSGGVGKTRLALEMLTRRARR
jgi:hypothetical protein